MLLPSPSLKLLRTFAATVFIVAISTLGYCDESQKTRAGGKDGDNWGRVLLEGELANSRAFSAFRCEYTITDGKADSVERAVQGSFQKEHIFQVEWLVKDDKECWSFRADDVAAQKALKAQAAKGAEGKAEGPFSSQLFLSNGREQISCSPAIGLANVHTPENPRSQPDFLPPGAEAMGPGDKRNHAQSYLKAVIDGTAHYLGADKFRGAELQQIQWKAPDASRESIHSIDPRRGYLPIHTITTSPGDVRLINERIITEAKQCSGARWFPLRALVLLQQSDQPHVFVREYLIKKLDADSAPPDADFRISLPRGTRVVFLDNSTGLFTVDAAMTVGLADIPKLIQRGAAMSEQREREGSEGTATSAWWWALGGGLVAVVCIAGLWRRYRLRRPSQGIQ